MTADLVVRSQRVVTPTGTRPAAVHIGGGRILEVAGHDDVADGVTVVDTVGVVSPGVVDSHVHVNEPGRTDWEGFATATRAAAAGGVTTIVDMPLNCLPPTTTVEALREKLRAATGKTHVDVAFWGGVVPGNRDALTALHDAGVRGFKAFLAHSGVDEYQPLETDELADTMRTLAVLDALLIVHAESAGVLARTAEPSGDPRRYATYLASRPDAAEVAAVRDLIALADQTGCRVHVLHLSSAETLDALGAARARGLPITAETCPHYLTLVAEDVPDGATAYKCAPPIRDAANRRRLWKALAAGLIDAVVSDHSPCPPQLKKLDDGDFLHAWGGISSLQLVLPLLWTAARARGFGPDDLARWTSAGPARIAGLPRKGAIAPGCDADLVAWHPGAVVDVDPHALEHRHPVTPYAGLRLHGVVEATYVRGVEVYRDGVVAPDPVGEMLLRP